MYRRKFNINDKVKIKKGRNAGRIATVKSITTSWGRIKYVIVDENDKLWMEHGGGGNDFESYTAAWYMGLNHTKLDCFDKQGRKGIIITMGDEPLNPYLPVSELNHAIGGHAQADIETQELYNEAREKFDIFHIAVDSPHDCYRGYKDRIEKSFGQVLGDRFKVSSVNNLAQTIEECIAESINNNGGLVDIEMVDTGSNTNINEHGQITW